MNRTVADTGVTVNFLDVGQGHATLIVDHGRRKAMLIDCPAGQEDVVEQGLDGYRAELEVAVITHFDHDHSAGVVTLLETRSCSRLVTRVNVGRRTPMDEAQHRRILAHVRRGLNFESARRHDQGFLGGSSGRVRWRILSPDSYTDLAAYSTASRNRASLVLRLEIRPAGNVGATQHVVVAGDADATVWRRLLLSGDNLSCCALLWPHHGGPLGAARSPLRGQVLAACAPQIVVISTGSRNGYRHPAQSTLDAVRISGARLACTQVTRRCHPTAALGTGLACSGSVELCIDGAGRIVVTPSAEAHLRVIDAWEHPQCVPPMKSDDVLHTPVMPRQAAPPSRSPSTRPSGERATARGATSSGP